MFNVMNSSNKSHMEKSSFWEKIYNQGLIPERNPDQLKKFWQLNKEIPTEHWLARAIHNNVDFSFSIKKIPSHDFTKNFRQKYEMEFIRLEALEPMNDCDNVHYNRSQINQGIFQQP